MIIMTQRITIMHRWKGSKIYIRYTSRYLAQYIISINLTFIPLDAIIKSIIWQFIVYIYWPYLGRAKEAIYINRYIEKDSISNSISRPSSRDLRLVRQPHALFIRPRKNNGKSTFGAFFFEKNCQRLLFLKDRFLLDCMRTFLFFFFKLWAICEK